MRSEADFEAGLSVGRMGEKLVAQWAQSRGMGVIPSYDYSGKDGEKAPRLMFADGGLVIPDLDLCKAGWRGWLEVKSYAAPAFNRRHGCDVHGFTDRLFQDYMAVERQSGCPVHVAILEVGSGALLWAALAHLEPQSFLCQCGCDGRGFCRAPIRRGRYWPRAVMSEKHRFSADELAEIRAAAQRRVAA